ncbi:hypothetical protein OUZ56_030315 [Daphnia magna]|uniref:Uncharacterized protein n=1 Tax=Daphnia magna TaxID=35525 RepID=A0ABQ9ZQX6_9CRUS|nr:hypothetical protein OUZ56_030315 [Daphnia magna]
MPGHLKSIKGNALKLGTKQQVAETLNALRITSTSISGTWTLPPNIHIARGFPITDQISLPASASITHLRRFVMMYYSGVNKSDGGLSLQDLRVEHQVHKQRRRERVADVIGTFGSNKIPAFPVNFS